METQIKIPHTEYRKIAKRRIAGETLVSIAKSYNENEKNKPNSVPVVVK